MGQGIALAVVLWVNLAATTAQLAVALAAPAGIRKLLATPEPGLAGQTKNELSTHAREAILSFG